MVTLKDQSVVSRGWGDGGDIGRAQGSEGRKSLCSVRVGTPSCTFHQTHGMYNRRANPTGNYGPYMILMCQLWFANCDTCPSRGAVVGGREIVHGREWDACGNAALAVQFLCEPKLL